MKETCAQCEYCIPLLDLKKEENGFVCIASKIFYHENICYVINDDFACNLFKKDIKSVIAN